MGFHCCDVDQAVFFKQLDDQLTIVAVHVNDCTITMSLKALIDEFKANLQKCIEVTDLGKLHWLLGIEVKCNHTHQLLHLSQCSYITAILCCFNLEDVHPLSMPMDPNIHYSTAQSPQTTEQTMEMRNIPYHKAVGSLMYLTPATRPDIAFAVAIVSCFSENPSNAHWEAV